MSGRGLASGARRRLHRVSIACALLATISSCAPAHRATWSMDGAAPIPLGRWGSAVAVVGDQVFVAGGWTGGDLCSTLRFDVYDSRHDRWMRLPDLPDSFTHVIPARVGRRLWFAGGITGCKATGRVVRTVWTYDIDDSTWRRGPSLPAPRAGGGLALLDDTLHYVGGFPEANRFPCADHWVLDPARDSTWSPRAPLPAPRGHLTVAVAAGRLYALGGQSEHDEHDVPWCTVYDRGADRWRRIADLPTPRSHVEPSTIVEQDRIVLIGGEDNTCWRARRDLRHRHWRDLTWASIGRALWGRPEDRFAMSDVTMYDPARDRWTELPALPGPLLEPTAAFVGGRVMVTGGSLAGWWAPQTTTRIGVLASPPNAGR